MSCLCIVAGSVAVIVVAVIVFVVAVTFLCTYFAQFANKIVGINGKF